jgi:acetylglutamate kinase
MLRTLLKSRIMPVIMPLAVDKDGELLNVNADDVAGAVAAALKAEKLILVTDTVLLADKGDPKSVISEINEDEIENLVWSGIISSGMVPKVEQALDALEAGVKSVHIIDGKQPRSLLGEVLTAKGSGTMIRRY